MLKDYKKQLATISRYALEGRLVEALDLLLSISRGLWAQDVNREAEKLQDSYEAMLRFVSEGSVDTASSDLVDSVTTEILALAMRLSRKLSMDESSEIYFSTARTTLLNQDKSLAREIENYREELHRLENDFDSITDSRRTVKAEKMLRDIFNRIWVTHPLSSADFDALNELMSPSMPRHARALAISAVGLGHVHYYDSKRLAWLFQKYIEFSDSDPDLALRALVEALLSMVRYRRRPLSKSVKDVINLAQEQKTWDKDFTSVAIELMRAIGTANISAKLKNGILGNLSDIDNDLREKIQKGEIDMETLGEDFNPEWVDKISNSTLGRNLREMAEIQAEGGDVFMASFSQMKRFPFFHDLANWYLPFYDSHSDVVSADSDDGLLGSLLARMPILCDSDKYSLILSAVNIPAPQRQQLAEAVRMQAEQMAESLSEAEKASGESIRRRIVNKYVQNIYRVLNLFRSKNDLYNYFNTPGQLPDLLQIKALDGNPARPELYETIAQFYFSNGLWEAAAAALAKIDTIEAPDARRSQQLGYAYEMTGEYPLALQAYDEAEMISPGSQWTMRRLAKMLRATGNYERASLYYKKLSDDYPENYKYATLAGDAFIEADMPAEAERFFHKALYLSPDNVTTLRSLAWAQFVQGKTKNAVDSYEKVLSFEPLRDDYVRAACAYMALGDLKQAITLLRIATQDDSSQISLLADEIAPLVPHLQKAGFDTSAIRTIIDTLFYLRKY